MGDDEAEHEPSARVEPRAPISKRKAQEGEVRGKPAKVPRLDVNGQPSSSHAAPLRTQPAPPPPSPPPPPSSSLPLPRPGAEKQWRTVRPPRAGTQSAASGASTSDFPNTITERIQTVAARDRREKEKETARKRTTHPKQVRKVSTANLLRHAQTQSSDARDDPSRAWIRVKPKAKAKRTNYDAEMARVRPLAVAKGRIGETIELTDSSGSTRVRPPQSGAGARSTFLSAGDPIIITSGSDDERVLVRPTQRRRSGPRVRVPPPDHAEVISLTDSEQGEDGGLARASFSLGSPRAPAPPTTSTSTVSPPPASIMPRPAPVPEPVPASTSRQVPKPPPLQGTESPSRASSGLSYGLRPDDFDDPFNNMDFDSGGGGQESDNLDIGPSLATLPITVPPSQVDVPPVEKGGEDVSASNVLFDSYLNMDQLEGDVDRGIGEGGVPDEDGDKGDEKGGDGETLEKLHSSEGLPTAGSPSTDEGKNGDTRMQSLEEGEVGSNDATMASSRSTESMESGEIRSQGNKTRMVSVASPRVDVRMRSLESGELDPNDMPRMDESDNQPPNSTAPSRVLVQSMAQPPRQSPSRSSPSSKSPLSLASQPLARTSTLVMPDISSYKGVRFKRSLPEARENGFFSRALNGVGRSAKMPVGEKFVTGGMPVPVDMPPSVLPSQNRDADLQDNMAASVPEDVVSMLLSSPQPADLTVSDTRHATRISSPAIEPSATASDHPPASSQPAPSSVPATPCAPPPASQPLVRSSSRQIIAPPRIPLPSEPMSLADLFNDLRQKRLLEITEQSRKRSLGDATTKYATPTKSASQVPATPAPTSSQPPARRALGKTPSLKDIRELLARRNVISPSTRSPHPPTPTPSRASNPESRVAASPVAVPAHVTSGDERVDSAEGAARREVSALSTPAPTKTTAVATPATVSESESGVGADTRNASASTKRRGPAFVPFEAFISPARPWDNRVPQGSPTVPRPRMSTGMLGTRTQRLKGNTSTRHRRRESAAAMFEAYIVRESARKEQQVSRPVESEEGKDAGGAQDEHRNVDREVEDEQQDAVEPVVVEDSEGEGSEWMGVMPEDLVGVPVGTSGESGDGDESADAAVADAGDVALDAKRTDDGEGEEDETDEMDETDALLQLASVHLSQADANAEAEVAAVLTEPAVAAKVDMVDEVSDADDKAFSMMVDSASDIEMNGALDSAHLPSPIDMGASPIPEDHVVADGEPSHLTPDLVYPEATDKKDHVRAVSDIKSEAPSSKTASSTSLAPPRAPSRSPRHSPQERSPVVKPAVDPIVLPLSLPVSEPVKEEPGSESTYRIITWESHVAEERKRSPEYRLSKDLPHSLQDYMNTFLRGLRDSDMGRQIFEAHMREAMVNEPAAPAIEIFDNNIGDEVAPQWEFHYTNEMWYSDDVPPPDWENLEGCGCIGRCDPKSSTCACAQRQKSWLQPYIDGDIIRSGWTGSPFVYDHRGLLQLFECPIFECNRFCRCDDDCPNRVVQHGRKWPVHIARTAHKGWGVIAGNKKIPKGSYIGIYAGELLTEQEGEARGKYYDLYGRTYLFSVDFHHLKMDMDDPDEWENLYVVDAYHAGNFTRFLNHSCDPNCGIFACYVDEGNVNKPLLAVFTTRDVEAWEELCFSYYGDMDEKREEIEQGGEMNNREHAVYAQCRCDAENCIGRLFS